MSTQLVYGANLGVFFFSSRRRHTRSYGDWSSDVCSSDLLRVHGEALGVIELRIGQRPVDEHGDSVVGEEHRPRRLPPVARTVNPSPLTTGRSEERRVGKAGRAGMAADAEKGGGQVRALSV